MALYTWSRALGLLSLPVAVSLVRSHPAAAQSSGLQGDSLYNWKGMSNSFGGVQQAILDPLQERAEAAGLPFANGTLMAIGFGGTVWMGRWQLFGSSTLFSAGSRRRGDWVATTRGAAGTVQLGYAMVYRPRTRVSVTAGVGRSSMRASWTPRAAADFGNLLDTPAQATTFGVSTWHLRAGAAIEHRLIVFNEKLSLLAGVGWQAPIAGQTSAVADERRVRGAPRTRQEGVYMTVGIGLPIRARDAVFAALGSAVPGGTR